MSDPLVSVIVPTFNRGYCLERTVRSALAQTHRHLEVLVIDDGSTDDTRDLVSALAVDARVRYIWQENQHVSAARNTGLRHARGAYIAFSGEAMPCCMIATPDRLNFGNVVKEGVAAVWNNDAYNAFRARLAADEPPEICRGCAVYNGAF